MRLPIKKSFTLFEVYQCDDQWWVDIAALELDDWNGSLIGLERDNGYWRFDFLYLCSLYYWWLFRKYT